MDSILGIFMFPIRLILFVVTSVAWFQLAVLRELSHPWMAFVPVLRFHVIGKTGDSLKEKYLPAFVRLVPLCWVLPVLCALSAAAGHFNFVPAVIGSTVSIIMFVLEAVVYYLVFCRYAPKNKLFFTVLACCPVVSYLSKPLLILHCIREDFAALEKEILK